MQACNQETPGTARMRIASVIAVVFGLYFVTGILLQPLLLPDTLQHLG